MTGSMPLQSEVSSISPKSEQTTHKKIIPLTKGSNVINENINSDYLSFKSNSRIYQTEPNKQNVITTHTNNDSFGTPLVSSTSSLNSSSPHKSRRRFDDRIRSRFSTISRPSQQLQSDSSQSFPYSENSPSSTSKRSKAPPCLTEIKWTDLEIMNKQLWSDEIRAEHGEATCIIPGDFIVIGTSRGHILIFDYKQRLINKIGVDSQQSVSGAIVTLAISLDFTHVASAMTNGSIFVWDIGNIYKPLIHIPPLRATDMTDIADGHIEGSTITNICFIGRRRSVLMSGDVHGMVILHRIHRRVFGTTCSSKRVLGHYASIRNHKPVTILGCAALPLGSYVDVTEDKGLVAIMNQNALVIVSTKGSEVKTELSTGKPQVSDTKMGNSGCLAWFPACVLKDGTKIPARLAYCFDNVLTIIEVSESGFVNSQDWKRNATDDGNSLSFRSQNRWICEELIVGIQWINNTLLGVLTHTQRFILINEKSMIPSAPLDLLARHIFTPDLYSNMETHQTFRANVNSTFKTYRGKLFIVGKYEILIGSLPIWIDKILDLVVKKEFVHSIELAMSYYKGDEIDLDSVALPLENDTRHELILNYLKDMINVSINKVITSEVYDEELHELLFTSIKALISVNAGSIVFEDLYELIRLRSLENVFFDALEPFVLKGDLTRLTATVLNNMIDYYSSFGKADQLERIICSLDITVLDIDSTLAVLKKKNLIDSYIYIWNTLLKDYTTPLLDMLSTADERSFGYLAYILTGRQYPTENQIESEIEANDAKLCIYYLLFNGTYVIEDSITSHENLDGASFPYLHMLLSLDSRSFLAAFNEILEDSLLNDDEIIHQGGEKLKVNRQFIIDILIEVFEDMELSGNDTLNLSIFIARNYPKFKQFIRLSENILDKTIKELCSYTTSSEDIDSELKYDCELSLQSLLSVYQPSNKSDLMDFFERAGFHEIMINLYLNDRRYSKVLQVWLSMKSTNSIDTTSGVLEKCFRSTERDKQERQRVIETIKSNFELIIETDTAKVVSLLNKYCPFLHKIALDSKQVHLKYMYLSSLAEMERSGSYRMNSTERTQLITSMSIIDPSLLLPFLKSLKECDYDFVECVNSLEANRCVDALVYLFNSKADYERSISELLAHIERLLLPFNKHVINQGSPVVQVQDLERNLWKYLQVAVHIANIELNQSRYSMNQPMSDLSQDEKLWLKIIGFFVQKLKEFDSNDRKSNKASDLIKRLLQDLFTSLINTRSKIIYLMENNNSKTQKLSDEYQTSFLKIFISFINSPKMNIAYLGDIRSVTKEIYLAFTYEKNVLTITSNLLNEVIYSNIQKSMDQTVRGWSIKNFECEACGKIIWGRGISSENFISWGIRKGLEEFKDYEYDNKNSAETKLDLISFDCGHCYHINCLKGLDVQKAVCILCHAV